MTARWANGGLLRILNGVVGNMESADIRWALLTASYTHDPDDEFMSELTGELTGGNYNRVTIDTSTISIDDTANGAVWDAVDPSFPSLQAAAGTPTWLVGYLHVGADSVNPILCILAKDADAPDGNNYVCTLPAAGIGVIKNVAGSGIVYNSAIVDIMEGTVDLLNDTLIAQLHTASYVADPDDDVDADATNELTDPSYAPVNLGGKSVALDDTNDGAYVDVTDPSYTSLDGAAPSQLVVRIASPDRLVAQLVLTTPDTPNGNNYVVNIAAPPAGLLWFRNSAS